MSDGGYFFVAIVTILVGIIVIAILLEAFGETSGSQDDDDTYGGKL